MTLSITRLSDQPLITPHMDDRMGDNINGPSVIRVPDWIEKPLGRYYLYFSHHEGRYIRMAYADDVLGPWIIYSPGVLDVADSGFPLKFTGDDRDLIPHIASPDVHVDGDQHRIRMYFHGQMPGNDQATRVSTSLDGLSFTPQGPMLGPAYLRAFVYRDAIFTIPFEGDVWRSEAWDTPFERGPNLLPLVWDTVKGEGVRHAFGYRVADTLHLLFTRMGDAPECILHTPVDLRPDWREWRIGPVSTILKPDLPWEGSGLPIEASKMGAVYGLARELRDPTVFQDLDGQIHLFYVGGGEQGIGVARIDGF